MARNPVRTLVVADAAAGTPLAAYLEQMLPPPQRPQIPTLLARGGVWVGKWRQQDPQHPLQARDVLRICLPPRGYEAADLRADHVLADDARWLVVHKPSGWYSQSTPWDLEGNLVGAVTRYLRDLTGQTAPFAHQVNRLDRETSGIVLFARKRELAGPLQAAWTTDAVAKRYVAVVRGHWAEDRLVDAPIDSIGQARFGVRDSGKPAQTVFRPIVHGDDWTVVEARPLTGRTHQIRVHAAHLGHPLLGDERYGGGRIDARQVPCEFFLHAGSLTLQWQGEERRWLAPLPPALVAFAGIAESELTARLGWPDKPHH